MSDTEYIFLFNIWFVDHIGDWIKKKSGEIIICFEKSCTLLVS